MDEPKFNQLAQVAIYPRPNTNVPHWAFRIYVELSDDSIEYVCPSSHNTAKMRFGLNRVNIHLEIEGGHAPTEHWSLVERVLSPDSNAPADVSRETSFALSAGVADPPTMSLDHKHNTSFKKNPRKAGQKVQASTADINSTGPERARVIVIETPDRDLQRSCQSYLSGRALDNEPCGTVKPDGKLVPVMTVKLEVPEGGITLLGADHPLAFRNRNGLARAALRKHMVDKKIALKTVRCG